MTGLLCAGLALAGAGGPAWGQAAAPGGVRLAAGPPPQAPVRPDPPPPADPLRPEAIAAASAILVEARTGDILYAFGARERRAPASLTKMMTAAVVLERARLADVAVAGPGVRGVGGHVMGLRPGHRATVRDLLSALLIRSANDAAVALAEHVAGSVPRFAALMNAKAKALGMQDTHFQNPHGLDGPSHYSTAYDLAILARYALQSRTFAEIVRARQAVIRVAAPGRRRGRPAAATRILRTHNRLLDGFEGADGVKTGFTGEAGRCLVASAQRDGRRLITVLLNDPRRWEDAAALLEYGFALLGAPAATRAAGPEGLAPPSRVLPEGAQVGG